MRLTSAFTSRSVLVLAVAVTLALLIPACDECVPEDHGSATSPDAFRIATVLVFDCGGATVSADTVVVVRSTNASAQPYDEGTVLTIDGNTPLTTEWTDPRTLRLSFARNVRRWQGKRNLGDVTVEFIEQ